MDSEKKLVTPDYAISKCPEHKVKLKIENTFVNEKILEEYCADIGEMNSYFHEHYKELIKLTKMVITRFV